jgi:hypothetical protein
VFIIEDYTCNNGASGWDCNIIIYLFTVQNDGLRKSVDNEPRWKLCAFTINFYAEITSCQQTSWHLKGYARTDWQCHVASTRLHMPSHSLLCPFQPKTLRTVTFLSCLPFRYLQKWLQTKIAFKSCHPWEPTASCLFPPPVLRHLFLSTYMALPLPLKSLYKIEYFCAWHCVQNSSTHHFMNNTTLQLHVWLEIKWHHFHLASVLFRFELQQVISAVVYMEVPVPSVVTGVSSIFLRVRISLLFVIFFSSSLPVRKSQLPNIKAYVPFMRRHKRRRVALVFPVISYVLLDWQVPVTPSCCF